MSKKRRGKNVRRQRRTNKQHQIVELNQAPHSFIFSRRGVGAYVKRLSNEMRKVFEPFTATNLKVTKKNVIKDFINVAGLYNVSHLMYFTHEKQKNDSENGVNPNVGMHLIRAPHGPTIVFNVVDYCYMADIQQLTRKAFCMSQYTSPPLLAMHGFSERDENNRQSPQLRLVVDMFQNMLPPLNVQKLKLNTVKRVLLISREKDPGSDIEYISLRHYHIKTENKTISKSLRRLGLGGSRIKKSSKKAATAGLDNPGLGPSGKGKSSGVPNLGKYSRLEDYLLKSGMLSDSGLSDFDSDVNEMELDPEPVAKDQKSEFATNQGFSHLAANKAAVKLIELGPRITLQLLKIEEGINNGSVLYHSYHKRSEKEKAIQEQEHQKKLAAKAARKAKDEENRQVNLLKKKIPMTAEEIAAKKARRVSFNEEVLDESALDKGGEDEQSDAESEDDDDNDEEEEEEKSENEDEDESSDEAEPMDEDE